MNVVSTLLLSLFWVFESTSVPLGYLSGDKLNPEFLSSLANKVHPGMAVLIGEKHYNALAQQGQMDLLQALKDKGFRVSVGLEFISYPAQPILESYRQGQISEAEFIKQSEWGAAPFAGYKELALFPQASLGEGALALNAPRQLTGKISKTGISSLLQSEAQLLPPHFQIGRPSYRKRFDLVMAPHVKNPQVLDNYFAAQSVWDDTMAWQATAFLTSHPEQVLVIVVGEFHVQYGGGLADRLRARGVNSILTLSQVDHSDYSDEELEKEINPNPEFGPRADFIWLF